MSRSTTTKRNEIWSSSLRRDITMELPFIRNRVLLEAMVKFRHGNLPKNINTSRLLAKLNSSPDDKKIGTPDAIRLTLDTLPVPILHTIFECLLNTSNIECTQVKDSGAGALFADNKASPQLQAAKNLAHLAATSKTLLNAIMMPTGTIDISDASAAAPRRLHRYEYLEHLLRIERQSLLERTDTLGEFVKRGAQAMASSGRVDDADSNSSSDDDETGNADALRALQFIHQDDLNTGVTFLQKKKALIQRDDVLREILMGRSNSSVCRRYSGRVFIAGALLPFITTVIYSLLCQVLKYPQPCSKPALLTMYSMMAFSVISSTGFLCYRAISRWQLERHVEHDPIFTLFSPPTPAAGAEDSDEFTSDDTGHTAAARADGSDEFASDDSENNDGDTNHRDRLTEKSHLLSNY